MPGGDGTGPFGTFRNCMPYGGFGQRGFWRRAPRRGWRFWDNYRPGEYPSTRDEELGALHDNKATLEQELQNVKKRLEELEKTKVNSQ